MQIKIFKILCIVVFICSVANAEDLPSHSIDAKSAKTIMCLYEKDINGDKFIKASGIIKAEHIENLLYNPKHKEKFLLKALVFDYYYKINNIQKYYERAYSRSTIKKKIETGLFYSNYLLRHNNTEEAIRVLRQIEVLTKRKRNIHKKIAYTFGLFNKKIDAKTKAYFQIRGVDHIQIMEEINVCSK